MTYSIPFEPTRAAGLQRLSQFVSAAGRHYQNNRNADLGPHDRSNVSALSPYIRHRLIAEEEVLQAVLAKHSMQAAEKFIQEIFWRSYFKGHLETRPAIWTNYCRDLKSIKLQGGMQKAFEAAIEGRTGFECFDAWVNELKEFGYLHNHTRMWFASIWIFTLRLPWQLGSDFMFRHLLDGDPASNTLSWRWVAGLHTKGKTYLARADNIETYTQGRFSPVGLAHTAVALEEPPLPSAQKIPQSSETYSGGTVGLLLTEEDLNAETWNVSNTQVKAIAGASFTAGRSDFPVSKPVHDFANAAVIDAVKRAGIHFNAPTENLETLQTESIRSWAKANSLETILTGYAPVGPVAERLVNLKQDLSEHGIRLIQLRRSFDTAAWPHSTKGFFALKEKIPMLVRHLHVPADEQLSFI